MEQPSLDLTIVLSGRNDNWMGTFDTVTPYVCMRNCELIERYTRNFEIIFVEWAPLEDRPPLSDRLAECDPRIRCMIVPKAIHDAFHPKLPFLQYHARNVGIRRSRGRIVLATNGDIILSPGTVMSLLSLDEITMLRAPRRDVSKRLLECKTIDEIIAFSEDPANIVIQHELHRPMYGGIDIPYLTNAAGDFIGMSRNCWFRCRGFHQRTDASMGVDAEMIHQAEALRIRIQTTDSPIFHIDHEDNQQGRMHFPPYSRVGFTNPPDWGLGQLTFVDKKVRIAQCLPGANSTFGSPVTGPTYTPFHGCETGLDLVDHRPLEHKVLVLCGLEFDDVQFLIRGRRRRLRLFTWAGDNAVRENDDLSLWMSKPRPLAGVVFLVSPSSPALAQLDSVGAEEGLHFIVCEKEQTTLSFLRFFLRRSYPALLELILFGFGTNGCLIANRLLGRPVNGSVTLQACDDSREACELAAQMGLKTITVGEMAKAPLHRLILVTPSVLKYQAAMTRQLLRLGLTEGKHFWVNFRQNGCDPKRRPLAPDHWTTTTLPDGRKLHFDPMLATLVAAGEFDLSRVAAGFKGPNISSSGTTRVDWNGKSIVRFGPWNGPSAPLPVHDECWLGIESTPELSARRSLHLARSLFPFGQNRLMTGTHRGGFKKTLNTILAARSSSSNGDKAANAILLAHASAECADGAILHAGAARETVTRWLNVGALAGGFANQIYSIILGNHRWADSYRPIRGITANSVHRDEKTPIRVARLFEHPACAAAMLQHHPVRLLVLSRFDDIRWLHEGFYCLSPLLVDGGLLVLVGSTAHQSDLNRFLKHQLIRDRRFEPLLWHNQLLILRRVPS